jgi:hypothetical protein
MQGNVVFLGGVGAGAGLMLLLDPAQGRRRRALARDRLGRAMRKTSGALGSTGRDLGHRLAGLRARLRQLSGRSTNATPAVFDDVLRDRVRARLGHVVSHPGAIDVVAEGGRVVLTGAIPGAERRAAIAAVARVAGVEAVDDCLDEAADLETVTAISRSFEGKALRGRARSWAAAPLLLGVALAGSLAIYGVRRAARDQALAW